MNIKEFILDEAKNSIPRLEEKVEQFRKILRRRIAEKMKRDVSNMDFDTRFKKLLRKETDVVDRDIDINNFIDNIYPNKSYLDKYAEEIEALKSSYKELYQHEYVFDEKDLEYKDNSNSSGPALRCR